jgi:hypothetical protein
VSWVTYWPIGLFSDYAALISLSGLVGALFFLGLAARDFRAYELGTSVKIPKTRAVRHIKKFRREISFNKLLPAVSEADFAITKEDLFARDTFMRSEEFDNKLLSTDRIPYTIGVSDKFRMFSNDHDIRRLQLQYIIPRVRGSRIIPTTNDVKCGMRCRLSDLTSAVELRKVGYFDSLITNEFYRSEIFFTNKLIEGDSGEISDGKINLTSYFPAFEDASTLPSRQARLAPLDEGGVGNHLGMTPLIVSSDNRVLLFRQGDTAVDRGSVVCSGSGSLDWRDLGHAAASDLLGAARVGMAREFCEEASATTAYRNIGIRARRLQIADAASRMLVTGFFRWVDRCGKPEFIGAGRTQFKYSELPPDDFEVTTYEVETIRVSRMDDFEALQAQLAAKFHAARALRMGLSSYLALRRLAEIARYRGASDQAKRRVFEVVQSRLELA